MTRIVCADIGGTNARLALAEVAEGKVAALGEPVVQHGPFVMNTGVEIHQAIKDFQTGRMGRLD